MSTSTTGRTARPGRRRGLRAGALLAAATAASLLAAGLATGAAAAPATGGAAPSAAATKKPATTPAAKTPATKKPTTKKPPVARKPAVPRTLGALSASMDKAIQAKGSVTHTYTMTVNGQAAKTRSGVVSWRKGFASFDTREETFGLVLHWISLPGITYLKIEEGSLPQAGPPSWEEHRAGGKDAGSKLIDEQLTITRQQLNPGRLYPGRALAGLKVTPGKPATIGGVKCSVYSVKMTAAQKYGSQPPSTRPKPAELRGGTVTTTFYVDPAGLPLKVVVVNSLKAAKYSEVSTFTRWGSPVVVAAPER